MRGERVLVTGGAGFIGSNLAEALAEENDVVILDDLSTGKLENIKDHDKKGAKW
jgi:UDP-glucose 4-epimerase